MAYDRIIATCCGREVYLTLDSASRGTTTPARDVVICRQHGACRWHRGVLTGDIVAVVADFGSSRMFERASAAWGSRSGRGISRKPSDALERDDRAIRPQNCGRSATHLAPVNRRVLLAPALRRRHLDGVSAERPHWPLRATRAPSESYDEMARAFLRGQILRSWRGLDLAGWYGACT